MAPVGSCVPAGCRQTSTLLMDRRHHCTMIRQVKGCKKMLRTAQASISANIGVASLRTPPGSRVQVRYGTPAQSVSAPEQFKRSFGPLQPPLGSALLALSHARPVSSGPVDWPPLALRKSAAMTRNSFANSLNGLNRCVFRPATVELSPPPGLPVAETRTRPPRNGCGHCPFHRTA